MIGVGRPEKELVQASDQKLQENSSGYVCVGVTVSIKTVRSIKLAAGVATDKGVLQRRPGLERPISWADVFHLNPKDRVMKREREKVTYG